METVSQKELEKRIKLLKQQLMIKDKLTHEDVYYLLDTIIKEGRE